MATYFTGLPAYNQSVVPGISSTNTAQYANPNMEMGQWAGLPSITPSFELDPAGLWRAARVGQWTGAQAANPYVARTAMQGFTPTYGSYLLGGGQGAFGSWLQQAANRPGPQYWTGTDDPTGWNDAMAASRALSAGTQPAQDAQEGFTPRQLSMMGFLSGENARQNALAMAQARLGGGIGMGARAREQALGRLYDIYGARASSVMEPTGGFINWLGGQLAT